MIRSKLRRVRPEASLQRAVCEHLRLTGAPDMLYYSIPNEGKRSAATGGELKRMGMQPGAADLAIIVAGHCYFLELKAKGGKQSDAQEAFETRAIAAGATYRVADNINTAVDYLISWKAITYRRAA
jgi:hypothetical protein